MRAIGPPLLLGVSRKSFIGHITGEERAADWKAASQQRAPGQRERVGGTAAAIALAVSSGCADILRVHDVAIMREAALVAAAIGSPPD